MDQLQQKQEEILGILRDPTLTHEQTVMTLAKAAENLLATPGAPEEYYKLKEAGIICDLFEGNAPYSPRYILPDYEKFFREGSQFLRLAPPTTLLEAITNLLILYHHVPSVTHFPVYIGRIDRFLEPFIEDDASAKPLIKHFLMQIDRTVTDSFCHGDIGPEATRAGRIILECERELQDSTPNITLLYDPKITPDDFALQCVEAALDCAKPSFANHRMFLSEFGEDYGIASCYNGLPVGGGAYTLTRLVLGKLAETAASREDFFQRALPHAVDVMCRFMDAKIKFLVEETPFFSANFLVKEGLIRRERFNGLFGMVGMNECVNTLMALEGKPDRFGHSEAADALGVEIMEAIDALVKRTRTSTPRWALPRIKGSAPAPASPSGRRSPSTTTCARRASSTNTSPPAPGTSSPLTPPPPAIPQRSWMSSKAPSRWASGIFPPIPPIATSSASPDTW